MKILALELSSARGSVALLNDGNVVFFSEWQNDRKNSGPFFEYLAEVLKELEKPDTIIVRLSPGSYAGTPRAISPAAGLQAASQSRPTVSSSLWATECETAAYYVIGA